MRRGGCCQFCGIKETFDIYEWHHVNDMDPKNKRIGTYVGQHPSAMKLQSFELYNVWYYVLTAIVSSIMILLYA